jgi:hypothetical protein
MNSGINNDKIIIKRIRRQKDKPSEIRIDRDGKVFIDGEIYNEDNPKYKGICMSIEKYQRIETGEETQKMIEVSKKAVKGETVVITDDKTPNRTQKTTVKF